MARRTRKTLKGLKGLAKGKRGRRKKVSTPRRRRRTGLLNRLGAGMLAGPGMTGMGLLGQALRAAGRRRTRRK